jgi:hypothetical protein
MSGDTVRIFIGSGEASRLERKTLIHSIRKHTRRPLDLYVFNGTHNAIERNDEPPRPAPMSLRVKYRNVTEFSLYRFLIPAVCGFAGRAIFLDSDTICLADIGELFDTPLDGYDFLAKRDAYGGGHAWGLSVMLIDCGRARFDLEAIMDEVDRGEYTLEDFARMADRFQARRPYAIGTIDPRWNEFDRYDSGTKLIHYTNLETQPWKYRGHPCGELWFRYFREARAVGAIGEEDVTLTLLRAYARRDLLEGNGAAGLRAWSGRTTARVAGLLHRLVGGAG